MYLYWPKIRVLGNFNKIGPVSLTLALGSTQNPQHTNRQTYILNNFLGTSKQTFPLKTEYNEFLRPVLYFLYRWERTNNYEDQYFLHNVPDWFPPLFFSSAVRKWVTSLLCTYTQRERHCHSVSETEGRRQPSAKLVGGPGCSTLMVKLAMFI